VHKLTEVLKVMTSIVGVIGHPVLKSRMLTDCLISIGTLFTIELLQEEVSKVQSGMSLDINLERSRVNEEVRC